MTTYYLAYATANDAATYRLDLAHFANMARHAPGVPAVEVFVAVSEVKPRTFRDAALRSRLERVLRRRGAVTIRSLSFKSNVGRDFSSFGVALNAIAAVARDDDYILFANRSAYGPSCEGWYRRYLDQYRAHPGVQLCGSTINFLGHPELPDAGRGTHVQTYVFFGRVGDFREFVGDFPGARETERLQVIEHGEIGLSRRILGRGGGLTCLAWPDHVFSAERPSAADLEWRDIKREVRGLPFQYRRAGYAGARPRLVDVAQQGVTKIIRRLSSGS